jgi:hypothetical protein
MGHELRRPEADFLRDGIYELRVSLGGVHHRILYFFHGATAAVVSHGLVKERVVPSKEIDHAVERSRGASGFSSQVASRSTATWSGLSRLKGLRIANRWFRPS